MKSIVFIFFIVNSIISYAGCPTQTICKSGTCYEEEIPSCGYSGRVDVRGPSSGTEGYQTWYKDNKSSVTNSEISQKTTPVQTYTPSVTSCAENGSCYGDISDVNGLPKTTSVKGYYRKDGTYVRGYYRSKSR